METKWNNKQGPRDRQAICLLVTEDGNIHLFTGSPVVGVCGAVEVGREKNGKWSNTTWAIQHRPSTAVVKWEQCWDTGRTWPQASWEAGFSWLAGKAPGVSRAGFDAGIRALWSETAARWDAVAKAADEFAGVLPLAHAEATATIVAQIANAKAEAEAIGALRKELASQLREVEYQKRELLFAQSKLDEEKAKLVTPVVPVTVPPVTVPMAAEKAKGPMTFNPFAGLSL